jgi:hypothetical protein
MDESTIRIKCQSCGAHTIISITPGTTRAVACSGCGVHLVEFESLRGFIYVLSHPQMPNLLKIGFTTRPVEERVAELNTTTAVPGPFVIEAVFSSSTPEQHELAVHETLAGARGESKDFFKVDLVEAIREVIAICGPPSYLRRQDLLNQIQPSPLPPSSSSIRASMPPRRSTARESRSSALDEAKRLREWQERMCRK